MENKRENKMTSINELIGDKYGEGKTEIDLVQIQINQYNKSRKEDDVYNCEKCGNKGLIAYKNEYGQFGLKPCDCYMKRKNRTKLKKLGLLEFLDFSVDINEDDTVAFLNNIKGKVKNYCEKFSFDSTNNWLFIGGKVGSGKTTRCVCALNYIMAKFPDIEIEYFNWDTRYKELVFAKNKEQLLNDLQNADLLYLDDFMRITGTHELTDIERDNAKAIIDYRYMKHLPTIISSELYLKEILALDEAIGSRISQRCNNNIIGINKSNNKNNLRLNKSLDDII